MSSDNRRFRLLPDSVLPLTRIEDARTGLKILAADANDGQGVLLTSGPVVPVGVLPLEFDDPGDYDRIDTGDRLRLRNTSKDETYQVRHRLSDGRRRTVLAGGTIASLADEERQNSSGG